MDTQIRQEEQKQRKARIDETRTRLQAKSSTTVRSALDIVRTEALEELLPDVVALLATPDAALRKEIFELLIDVHSSALVTSLAEALEKDYEADVLALILSVCWQSPLDYSPLLERLLLFMSHPHLQVVIETMTSLEIAFDHASRPQLEAALKQLKKMQKEEKRQEVRLLLEELQSTCSRSLQQVINNEREEKHVTEHHHHDHCGCGDANCHHEH